MTFILLLIVIFVVWPIVRVLYAIYRLRSQTREAFRRAADAASAGQSRRNKAGWSRTSRPHKKVIDPGEGEYVEWEEITVTQSTDTSSSGQADTHTVTEQQVTDVEWEDINN